jgi:hypothetical protein
VPERGRARSPVCTKRSVQRTKTKRKTPKAGLPGFGAVSRENASVSSLPVSSGVAVPGIPGAHDEAIPLGGGRDR